LFIVQENKMNDYIITYTLLPAQRCKQYVITTVPNAEIAKKLFLEEVPAPKNQTIKINSVEIG